ncbi:hypothetical protein ADUPG1_012722 [Aduncisulcus paluster]|uniref:CS domain-containing protein n=1 Tax=Aduncisulcus paluster TaxID=2918883 RepID=A0ABQ5K0F3_9EUKA|nr:hypothetical protein ADUPG1_012722 [Aduncisulcus paluster]
MPPGCNAHNFDITCTESYLSVNCLSSRINIDLFKTIDDDASEVTLTNGEDGYKHLIFVIVKREKGLWGQLKYKPSDKSSIFERREKSISEHQQTLASREIAQDAEISREKRRDIHRGIQEHSFERDELAEAKAKEYLHAMEELRTTDSQQEDVCIDVDSLSFAPPRLCSETVTAAFPQITSDGIPSAIARGSRSVINLSGGSSSQSPDKSLSKIAKDKEIEKNDKESTKFQHSSPSGNSSVGDDSGVETSVKSSSKPRSRVFNDQLLAKKQPYIEKLSKPSDPRKTVTPAAELLGRAVRFSQNGDKRSAVSALEQVLVLIDKKRAEDMEKRDRAILDGVDPDRVDEMMSQDDDLYVPVICSALVACLIRLQEIERAKLAVDRGIEEVYLGEKQDKIKERKMKQAGEYEKWQEQNAHHTQRVKSALGLMHGQRAIILASSEDFEGAFKEAELCYKFDKSEQAKNDLEMLRAAKEHASRVKGGEDK